MESHAIAGSLEYFTAPQLLRLLQSARATGRLELTRGAERTDLFVEEGRSLFARTSGASLRVGDVLVRRGEVRREAIEFVLAVQEDQPGARLGRMLVDSGALTEAQIRDAIRAVQRHIVLGVLMWREGSFRFLPGEVVAGEDVRLDLDLDELLTSALIYAASALRPDDREAA